MCPIFIPHPSRPNHSQSKRVHSLAVAQQAVGEQLGLLPVGGSHVIFAMSLLEGLADPDSPELADQGMLPCQPALVVLHNDADDLGKGGRKCYITTIGSRRPVKA